MTIRKDEHKADPFSADHPSMQPGAYTRGLDKWNGNAAGTGKSSNPKDRAATSRLDISLYPQTAILYGALGMTEGDIKYGGYNYRAVGVSVSTYIAAACRHLFKYYNGEWCDPVTRVPHMASALACIGIVVDSYEMGNLVDDRPPSVEIHRVLSEFEEIIKHMQTTLPHGPERVTQLALIAQQSEAYHAKHPFKSDAMVFGGAAHGTCINGPDTDDPARAE